MVWAYFAATTTDVWSTIAAQNVFNITPGWRRDTPGCRRDLPELCCRCHVCALESQLYAGYRSESFI